MNKKEADELIIEYQKKVFGFAMEKTHNISEAEELAADIVYELYKSFRSSDYIVNVNGYVYRIAQNVFAKFLDKRNKHKHLDIMDIPCAIYEKGFDRLDDEETYQNIRKQIGLLSERQRVIIYMYYYDNISIKDIAKRLNISSGTVKWHLSDAKSNLKEEMVMVRKDNLSVNPIKFVGMGHSGSPGSTGDTSNMFDSRLKQNIAWSCYYKARNVEEIARALEVPIAYIEGELQKLVDWGYMDQVDKSKNPKYLTNMYITDSRNKAGMSERDAIYEEMAKYLCNNLYKEIFERFDLSDDNWGFECVDNDKNFMKYSLVMLIHKNMVTHFGEGWDKFAVKRPDGGEFISYAVVSDDCGDSGHNENQEKQPHWFCGYMFREVMQENQLKMQILQGDCEYCDRSGGWIDNKNSDWESLYKYIKNNCDKNKLTPEEYKRICEKGYVSDGNVNLMKYKTDNQNLYDAMDKQIKKYVSIPQNIIDFGKEMDEKLFSINRGKFPERMAELVKFHCDIFADGTIIPLIIEEMLRSGMLKPLADIQRKNVFTIICYHG